MINSFGNYNIIGYLETKRKFKKLFVKQHSKYQVMVPLRAKHVNTTFIPPKNSHAQKKEIETRKQTNKNKQTKKATTKNI